MQAYMLLAFIGLVWSAGIAVTGYLNGYKAGAADISIEYKQIIDNQKTEAARVIAVEYKAVQEIEQKLRDAKNQQEVTDAQNKQQVDDLSYRVRTLTGTVGRLRDSTDAGCGDGGGGAEGQDPAGAGNSANNGTQAGRLLSKSTSDLFQRIAREADEINNAYISCRKDALSVREPLKK